MKSRKLRCVVHVETIREAISKPTYRTLVGKHLENGHLGHRQCGSTILRQHKRERLWIWNVDGTNSGLCTTVSFGISGNESAGSVTIMLRERNGIRSTENTISVDWLDSFDIWPVR
jgi:hypothetical protein